MIAPVGVEMPAGGGEAGRLAPAGGVQVKAMRPRRQPGGRHCDAQAGPVLQELRGPGGQAIGEAQRSLAHTRGGYVGDRGAACHQAGRRRHRHKQCLAHRRLLHLQRVR